MDPGNVLITIYQEICYRCLGPYRGRRDLLSHKVLMYPGLQRIYALLCVESIRADGLHQKRHLYLVNAPLCVLRYSFMQVCSRAVRICHRTSGAAASFLSFWLIHQLTIPFRYDWRVPSPWLYGSKRGKNWLSPVDIYWILNDDSECAVMEH